MSATLSPTPPTFRRLAWSSLAAQSSEQVALAAAPLVAVLALGAGAVETGLLQTAQTLPFLLLSLPAGVLADRASRRRLMLGAEWLRAAALAGVLALLWLGGLGLGALAALGFLGAVGTVAYSVAAPALVPALVPREGLAAANRMLELARSTAFAAGPALGGMVVGWAGAPAAYILATILSLCAIRLLAGLPEPTLARSAGPGLVRAVREGAGFVLGHGLLRPILLTAVVFNLSWFLLQAVYVAYAVEQLGLGATGVGLTLSLYGAGMVAGAWAAAPLARRMTCGTMIAIGPASAVLAAALLLATLAVPPGWPAGLLAGAGFFLFGAGPILWTIGTTTLRQAVTPGAMLGRVSALVLTATFGARPLGAALGAALAARYGAGACLWACAAGFTLQFLLLSASPVPRLRALPAA